MELPLPKGRYLITGAAGFLGSHLSDSLLRQGAEVVGLDNFITGSRDNLREALKSRAFSFVEQDVCDPISVDGGFAGVFHLASPASPVDYLRHPIETLRTGSLGTERALQFAVAKRCPILVASTSEIYGDPLEHPQKETYWGHVNSLGPRSCYDEAKRYLEAATMAYHRAHGVPIRIVRIFNTYGPRMREEDGRVVPNFCVQALKGAPLTVYGQGRQTRSFCYVDDLIDGIQRLMASDYGAPVNLGNPNEISISEFAERILKLSGSQSPIEHRPLPQDDPKTRCPDITVARTVLGWEPKVALQTGLERTFAYFRDHLKR